MSLLSKNTLSALQIISLVCVSIVFAVSMENKVEKYVLPWPKEECWYLFVFVILCIGALYFVLQKFIIKRAMNKFTENFFNNLQ